MLKEIRNVRQIEGESVRRWFSDGYFDLIVWMDPGNDIRGFQLCYDKPRKERALTWKEESGYTHHLVDDGEARPAGRKKTPILLSDGLFDSRHIEKLFTEAGQNMEQEIRDFVLEKIRSFQSGTLT